MLTRLSVALYLILQAAVAFASLPFATGEVTSPECIDAIKIAREMFRSQAPRLYSPITIPKDLQSNLILGSSERDISGGDALKSTDDFEKLPQHTRNIYWAKKTDGALRVVMREIPFGWRGDMYSLYLLDSAVTKDEFLNNINSATDSTSYQPVISENWRPPLVFQDAQREATWFIDVGQPFQILSNWHVYSSKEKRAICTIVFTPTGSDPVGNLPEPVRTLAHKLDEALGPGNDEGTLQPTARTRLDANHTLANAALRPWALADEDAYNSRTEVDAGLEDWAKVNNSRRRLYNEILKGYPVAERSLAAYYASEYKLQPQKARESAAWVLDLVYRSFFVFSKDRDSFHSEDVTTNPWPVTH